MPLGAIKSLQDAWNVPLGNFFQGQDAVAQQQAMDAQTLQDMYSKSQFEAQERPLKLQDTLSQIQARRLGMDATRESMRGAKLKNDWDEETIGPRMAEFLAANKGKISQAHLDEAVRAGQGLQILAEDTWANPTPGYDQRAKQKLARFGIEWNPKWNGLSPEELAMAFSQYGTGIMGTIPKFQQAMSVQDSKNEAALEKARIAAEAAQKNAILRGEIAQLIATAKQGAAKSPKKLEELAAAIKSRMMVETDPEMKMELQSKYLDIMTDMWNLKTAGVQEPKPQIDPNVAPGVLAKPEPKSNPFDSKPKLGTKENPIKLD